MLFNMKIGAIGFWKWMESWNEWKSSERVAQIAHLKLTDKPALTISKVK